LLLRSCEGIFSVSVALGIGKREREKARRGWDYVLRLGEVGGVEEKNTSPSE
jgi:hypothetical protein